MGYRIVEKKSDNTWHNPELDGCSGIETEKEAEEVILHIYREWTGMGAEDWDLGFCPDETECGRWGYDSVEITKVDYSELEKFGKGTKY